MPSFGFGWAFNVGGSSVDAGQGIATDSNGDVYITGYVSTSNVNFDPNNTNPVSNHFLPGSVSGFAAKYLANGTFQWVAPLGSSFGGAGERIAVLGTNVYIAYEEPSGNKIAQLDANSGTIGWTVPTAGGRAIAVGPFMGNVYVTGSNSAQAFVTKLDTSGVIQWTKTTSGGTAEGISVAVYDNPNNGSESIYVTGDYLGTVDFDPSSSTFPLTNIPPAKNIQGSGTDIFAWNLNADGTFARAGSMGSDGGDVGRGIAVDASGYVYVTGWWGGGSKTASKNNDFDPGSGVLKLTNKGDADIFVVKLNPTLTLSWAKSIGGNSLDMGSAVAVDLAGHVYTTGHFGGSVDFDPGSGQFILQIGGGAANIFVSELDSGGNFVAAASMTGNPNLVDSGGAIAVDNTNPYPNVYTTGLFRGTADFDPTTGTYPLTADTSVGDYNPDLFVSKLTQLASPLRAMRGSTQFADATSADQVVTLLLVPGSVTDPTSLVADGGSRGQKEILPIAPDVLRTAQHDANPTTTLQTTLTHSPPSLAVDWLFADLVSGGLFDTLAADVQLAPSA